MAKDNGDSHQPLSRRGFLARTTGGAALAMAGWPSAKGMAGEASSLRAQEKTETLDTGGIAIEHFEAARKRAKAMVAKLTLDEKISQFGATAAAVPRINLPEFRYYASEALHGLIHDGPITSFPLPLALGCSWNRSLIHRVFTAVSDEVWAWHKKNGQGLPMFSPPTVNMGTRDPRWGRIGENYSEDPCLVSELAISTIHAMQGNHPRYLKTIACAKHFIANDTDSDRHITSATVDARSFWEYYSQGFEACVREGQVFTVMSSYNAMNGIPTTANRFLLTDLLRKRWGFRGYVVSDCGAISNICHTHKFVPTDAEAAALAVNAGCDVNCGDVLEKYLGEAVSKMLIGEPTLDEALVRAFTGRILLGTYDPPEQNPYKDIPISCIESPAHRELAREAARQSIVLFKNKNNTLPLDKSKLKKIAVIGPMAGVCNLGNYSGAPKHLVSPLQGVCEYLGVPIGATYFKIANEASQLSSGLALQASREGGEELRNTSDGSWAAFDKVLFTGATEFHARVYSDTGGPVIEVHLDSLTGPVVSRLVVANAAGGPPSWTTVSAPLKPVSGEHTVYLRFVGQPDRRFILKSFYLSPAKLFTASAPGKPTVTYALGCSVMGVKNPDWIAAAVKAAREADAALVFVGGDEELDAEGHDRTYLHLPGAQHDLVEAVYNANPRTILVISSNCPVGLNWWEQANLPAIVGGIFLGEQQGLALADVLFGDYNPGGKLSTTWYQLASDLPPLDDYDIRHGRTYMYFRRGPMFPFGHGLSYTTFEYKNLRISGKTLKPGGKITLSADITNSGGRDGDEVVQVYVHVAGGTVERPIKQLVNFDRVHLKAGETRTVSLDLAHGDRALRYWDERRHDFVAEPGPVDVMIGASSADIRLKGQVQLAV